MISSLICLHMEAALRQCLVQINIPHNMKRHQQLIQLPDKLEQTHKFVSFIPRALHENENQFLSTPRIDQCLLVPR